MRLITLLLLLLLTGCAARTIPPAFPLNAWPGVPLANMVHVSILKGTKTFQFDGFAELEAERVVLVGLTPAGTRGFSLILEQGEIDYQAIPFYRLPLKPRELMTLFQMVYWPLTELPDDHRVEQHPHGRVFYDKHRQIASVTWPVEGKFHGKALFQAPAEHLTVEITTRTSEPLEEP